MEYPRWQFSTTWLPLLDAAGKHLSCKNPILSRRGRKSRCMIPNVKRMAKKQALNDGTQLEGRM